MLSLFSFSNSWVKHVWRWGFRLVLLYWCILLGLVSFGGMVYDLTNRSLGKVWRLGSGMVFVMYDNVQVSLLLV